MQVVQTHLTQATETGMRHLIMWLPVDPRLKQGVTVDLDKNPNNQWKVTEMFSLTADAEELSKKRGLDLPKSQRTER